MAKKRRRKAGGRTQTTAATSTPTTQKGKKPVPWRIKSGKKTRAQHLRDVRAKFRLVPLTKKTKSAKAILDKGNSLSPFEALNFLSANPGPVKELMIRSFTEAGDKKLVSAIKKHDVGEVAGLFEPEEQVAAARNTAAAIVRKGTLGIDPKQHTQDYLRARKIPVKTLAERAAVDAAVNEVFGDQDLPRGKPIDVAGLEKSYLTWRKRFKGLDNDTLREQNLFTTRIARGAGLTKREKSNVRGWVLENWDAFDEAQLEAGKDRDGILTIRDGFVERGRDEVVVKLLQKRQDAEEKEQAYRANLRQLKVMRSNERAARLANYVPTKAAAKPLDERAMKIRAARAYKIKGGSIDSVWDAMNRIKNSHPETHDTLLDLLDRRKISRGSIRRLAIRGELAQRHFNRFARDSQFLAEFGEDHFDCLAKGLANIGAQGRQIANAQNGFRGPRGMDMFNHLDGRGFFEYHTGGQVIYLPREF